MTVLLEADRVTKRYSAAGRQHVAVDGVSFSLAAGSTTALVGESGAGKSTLVRLIAGLEQPTDGEIRINGAPPRIRPGRPSDVQMVFQHPLDALNPLRSVGASIAAPLHTVRRAERLGRVRELMALVGLDPARASDRPRAFSGGQLQRVVIARALAAEPKLLICDEPTSALDVSVQAQVVNLLLDLQEQYGFGCVLVTHDLSVAKVLADEILLLRKGRTVERCAADRFFAGPETPYGRALLEANAIESGRPGDADAATSSRMA